jgi:DNA mismatch repair ATPase MutS
MLTFEEKIIYLENSLNKTEGNYYDNFKEDIIIYFDEFNTKNERLNFLNFFVSFTEIDNWVEKISSRFVLKFDEESEQINDFIYDFIENG